MGPVTDLVMPKLGLTMTEGRIARWALRPGGRFAAGEVVVVVETDKIANEVEAPRAGILLEVLEPEGAIAPVGKPIARWRPDDEARPPGRSATDGGSPVEQAPAPEPTEAAGLRAPRAQEGRLIATPYARRLAREAGVKLAGLDGSGPRGRIKGADVLRAVEGRKRAAATAGVDAVQERGPIPSAAAVAQPVAPAARALSFTVADVDMGCLREIGKSLLKSASGPIFAPRDYAVLACVRAIGSIRDNEVRPAIGVEVVTPDGAALASITAPGRVTLSSLAAQLRDLEQTARKGGLRPHEQTGGTLVILSSGDAVRAFGPAVPAGWEAALGLGAVRPLLRPDPAGRPALGYEMTLVLSYDAQALPHAAALRFLGTVKALLEEPLALLAG